MDRPLQELLDLEEIRQLFAAAFSGVIRRAESLIPT
jgi:hypothetical protein